jgi:antitoxin PrlF
MDRNTGAPTAVFVTFCHVCVGGPGHRLTSFVGIDILTVGMEGREMADSSVISTKGQVTVPKRIRTRLGLRVGDRVEFVVEGNHTIIRPAREAGNPFEQYAGALGTFPGGIEEINAWVRSLRDEEPAKR